MLEFFEERFATSVGVFGYRQEIRKIETSCAIAN